jgi:hypothetical protein
MLIRINKKQNVAVHFIFFTMHLNENLTPLLQTSNEMNMHANRGLVLHIVNVV